MRVPRWHWVRGLQTVRGWGFHTPEAACKVKRCIAVAAPRGSIGLGLQVLGLGFGVLGFEFSVAGVGFRV